MPISSTKQFISIGHITKDLKPAEHLGGASAYSAVAAKRLGFSPVIATKCRQNDSYIGQLNSLVLDDERLRNDVCWGVFDY